MRKHPGQADYGSNFTTCIGVVKSNADPAHHGRLQIYIPSIDSKNYELEDLPWASYVSPFGGSTVDYKAGREQSMVPGVSTYGFWAIPKINAQVLCGFIEGEPNMRFWMGCIYQPELNRTLPSHIDPLLTEIDESGMYPQKTIPHLKANLGDAGLAPGSNHYKTRGGYERSISHPSNKNKTKPTDNGYFPKPHEPSKADSQTICLTSPGRHYFVMSDVDEYCRVRLKTCEGSQIIFDDTNERIYISTAKGRNWIELDETSGKIYIFSDSKVNIRAKNDINMYSDENINIVANKRVNIRSEERAVEIQAKHDVRLLSTDADVMATASRDIHLKTFDGPKAPKISEEQFCDLPPLHGGPKKGWVYRWGEKGGSDTSKIRLNAVDTIEQRSEKGGVDITGKTTIHIKAMDSVVNVQAGTHINLKAASNLNGQAGATYNILGGTTNLTGGLVNFAGSIFTDPMNPGPQQAQPSDTANVAEQAKQLSLELIVDHMIRPEHESWTRDEDESKCKTPRNPKYQG